MNSGRPAKDTWAISAENSALVVVDMQRAFVDEGAPKECVGAREFVPKINELTATCRRLKIPVIYLKSNRRADQSDAGLSKDIYPRYENDEMLPLEGKKGAEFCSDLNITAEDYIVPKIRYSALIPGSSSLEPLLRGLGRDSFIICGVATDVCVESTVRDAMMLGFKTFVVGDLTATHNEERRKRSLEVLDKHFAKVLTFDEVMTELAQLAMESQTI